MTLSPLVVLVILITALLSFCSVAVQSSSSSQWCSTSINELPAIPAVLPSLSSSFSYLWYGAGDDECSDFYFSAIDLNASSSSPTVLVRADASLNISVVNAAPIPAKLLSQGLRYIPQLAYFNLHVYAPIVSSLPSLPPSSSSLSHRHRRPSTAAAAESSVIALLSMRNLSVVSFFPVTEAVALRCLVVDYSDASMYAAVSSPAYLLHFSIASSGSLSRMADLSISPMSDVMSAVLLAPRTLLFLLAAGEQLTGGGDEAAVSEYVSSVLQVELDSGRVTAVLNVSSASPASSFAAFWSVDRPGFGSMHLIDSQRMLSYDEC